MEIQPSVKNRHRKPVLPLVLIGIGLILIGLVAVRLISYQRDASDITVIPQTVSFPAPDLSLNDLHGQKVTLSDYRPRIVLINNWATWCPPCKAEMPVLSKYFKDHSDHNFTLIGIEAGDPAVDVAQFVDENAIPFTVLLDPNTRSLNAFNNDNLPSSYVIDQNGNVVLAWTGPINRAMLEKYVTPLLEQ